MTTKEQERKALEQIRKIVEGLGEDSYVATAFEGCFEDAKENIENDWALSMNGRWQDAEQKIEQYKTIRDELVEENNNLKKEIETLKAEAEDFLEEYKKLGTKLYRAQEEALDERKEVKIETTDGNKELKQFKKIEFFGDYADFKFINVVEKSGWTNSYKIDDLKVFEIQ